VFLRSYTPRTLNEVYDPERDVDKLARGEGKDLIYGGLTGIVQVHGEKDGQGHLGEKKAVKFEGEAENGVNEESGENDEEEEDADSDSEDEGNGEFQVRQPRGHRHEDKDAKKERKKAAKEEAREKRKNKIPKAEKKKRIKATSSKK